MQSATINNWRESSNRLYGNVYGHTDQQLYPNGQAIVMQSPKFELKCGSEIKTDKCIFKLGAKSNGI